MKTDCCETEVIFEQVVRFADDSVTIPINDVLVNQLECHQAVIEEEANGIVSRLQRDIAYPLCDMTCAVIVLCV